MLCTKPSMDINQIATQIWKPTAVLSVLLKGSHHIQQGFRGNGSLVGMAIRRDLSSWRPSFKDDGSRLGRTQLHRPLQSCRLWAHCVRILWFPIRIIWVYWRLWSPPPRIALAKGSGRWFLKPFRTSPGSFSPNSGQGSLSSRWRQTGEEGPEWSDSRWNLCG